MLVDTAQRLFSDLCTADVHARSEAGEWIPALWSALEGVGLVDAARSSHRGGAGADLGDVLAVIREAGAASLPAPLAETMIAELLLAAAGLPSRPGALAIGPVVASDELSLKRRGRAWTLSGVLHRVPWGRWARSLVVIARAGKGWGTAIVDAPKVDRHGRNFAHEPRDDFRFDGVRIDTELVALADHRPDSLRLYGALFRLAAMTGALDRLLAMTVEYAVQRVQFGRPIAKFQAVQQQIAVLASQVGAASAATDATIEALQHGSAHFEIAAAKLRVGEAAGIAVAIAHQVHGAMGFTREHALHRSTRRLWSWRDEFGSENEWAEWLGEVVAALGSKELWPFLTSEPKSLPVTPAQDVRE